MKKIFSLMMVIVAVAMVSCCGNANQKKAECCPENAAECVKSECCAECDKANECPKKAECCPEAAAPAEEAPAAVPAE